MAARPTAPWQTPSAGPAWPVIPVTSPGATVNFEDPAMLERKHS
jgi:hypothetical protein